MRDSFEDAIQTSSKAFKKSKVKEEKAQFTTEERYVEASCNKINIVSSNISIDCRFMNAKKRKLVLPLAEFFDCSRKRLARCSYFSNSNICGTDNVISLTCNSHSRVCVAHEMELG